MPIKSFTLDDLDELCERAIEKIHGTGFEPDTVVGITTGGAILGRIISLKLGKRFCPDYRKYGRSVYFPLPKDAKKILVVDDKLDLGETFRRCFQDIIDITLPGVDGKTLSLTMQNPVGLDVRFFAFLDGGDAPYDRYYSLFNSLDYEFPWDMHNRAIKNKEFLTEITGSGVSWKGTILKLIKELAQYEEPNLGEFYQNRPLSKEILNNFQHESAEISYVFSLKRELDEEEFLDICKEHNFIVVGGKVKKLISRDLKNNAFEIKFNPGSKQLELQFKPENLRTLDEMCENCEFKSEEQRSICQTCNTYIRSVEALEMIYYVMEDKYGISEIQTILENSGEKFDLKRKVIEDLKRRSLL